MEAKGKSPKSKFSATFKVGAVSLAFLIIGYQAALFVHKAAVTTIAAHRDSPDTVYVVDEDLARRILEQEMAKEVSAGKPPIHSSVPSSARKTVKQAGTPRTVTVPHSGAVPQEKQLTSVRQSGTLTVRKDASHSREASEAYSRRPGRKVENFRFNPNTVSEAELVRLGFSSKQAASILHYREKGGKFRRKGDFAKSFVVSDSVYARLEPYIDIPLTDINSADSAAFDALPGIGPYFAARMVSYRNELGGYSCKEQLMEIRRFDEEKFRTLEDLICCSPAPAFPLWSAEAGTLASHPHIRSARTAAAIVLYRENNPREAWTVSGLLEAGVLNADQAEKLSRCVLE